MAEPVTPPEEPPALEPSATAVTLNDAAEQLGVHYMTAYRYVRTGRLEATKRKGQWWVEPAELEAIANAPRGGAPTANASVAASSPQTNRAGGRSSTMP